MDLNIPQNLQKEIENNNVILFIGAGLSVRFGFPDWNKLIVDFLDELIDEGENLINLKDYYEKGEEDEFYVLNKILKRNSAYREQLLKQFPKIFDIPKKYKCEKLDLHKKLWKLSNKFITTNYDKALEYANRDAKMIEYENIARLDEVHKKNFVFKLHGDLNRPDECILFEDDYKKLYKTDQASIKDFETLIRNNTVIFIGFSLKDPYVTKQFSYIKNLYKNYSPKHYIITTKDEDFSNFHVKSLQLEKREDLESLIDKLISFRNLNGTKEIQNPFSENAYVEELVNNPNERYQHKKYFYENILPYVKRSKFKDENSSYSDFVTEIDLYENLFKSNEYNGLLIYGEGGIGKTRLMLELGFLAKKDDWTVLKVKKTLSDLKDLKLPQNNKKYCLLFDYIEESEIFKKSNEILNDLYELYENTQFKIIANSRNTYMQDKDVPYEFKGFYIDLEDKAEIEYKKYVIAKIYYKFTNINIDKENIEKMNTLFTKPSFIVFLFSKESLKSSDDVKSIMKYNTIQDYFKQQLVLTFKSDFANIKRKVFYLLASLPMKQPHDDKLLTILESLVSDGWLEYNDEKDEYNSFHDTFVDELLIAYFNLSKFNQKRQRKSELKELFKFSNKNETLNQMFRSLDRISYFKKFESSVFYEIFTENINKKTNIFDENIQKIFGVTSLLNEEDRFKLLSENKKFFENYISDYQFSFPLSFAVNKAYKENNQVLKTNIEGIFNIWFSNNKQSIVKHFQSYRILSTYIKLFGLNDNILDYALNWIENFYIGKEASFVINSYLEANGDIKLIESYIVNWLKLYFDKKEASFIISRYLEAKGNIKLIEKYIAKRIEKYSDKEEASFIISSYLEAKGDIKLIESYIVNWLKLHFDKEEASFIINNYLEAKDDIKLIDKYIVNWLEIYFDKEESTFIIEKYLKSKGDINLIENYIVKWLEIHSNKFQNDYFMKTYLKSNGDVKLIENYIVEWLEIYSSEFEADHLINSYLKSKGDIKLIENYVASWLKKYFDKEEISFIIKAFLEAKGDIRIIEECILKWLEKYMENKHSREILVLSLQYNFNLISLNYYLKLWFNKFGDTLDSRYFLERLLNYGYNIKFIKKYVKSWLDKYIYEVNANLLISNWIHKTNDIEFVEKYIQQWLEQFNNKHFIKIKKVKWLINRQHLTLKDYQYHFNQLYKNSNRHVRDFLMQLLNYEYNIKFIKKYVKSWLDKYIYEINANLLIERWIIKTDNLEFIEKYVIKWLKQFNNQNEKVTLIFYAWMQKLGKFEIIKPYLDEWIERGLNENKLTTFIKYLFEINADREVINNYLKKIAKHNLNNLDVDKFLNASNLEEILKQAKILGVEE